MKAFKLLPLALLMLFVTSCSSVKVTADYDKAVDFQQYKTYAFFKEGIDQAKVNDLDKKRILNAIDANLATKGFSKTDKNPDFVINIFTKAQEQVNVTTNSHFYSPYGYYGWGWGPYWGPNNTTVTTSIEGTLYIDILDTNKKALIWQGIGTGYLDKAPNPEKKEQRINDFIEKILAKFPPVIEKK